MGPAYVRCPPSSATLGLMPFRGGLGNYYAPGITYNPTTKQYTDTSYYGVSQSFPTLQAAIVDSCVNQLTACNINYKVCLIYMLWLAVVRR